MTAPEKIILDCKRWVDSNTGKFSSYSFEGEFRDADIYTTQDDVSYTRSDLYEAALNRIEELESQLALAKIASEPVYSRRQLEAENAELKAALIEGAEQIDICIALLQANEQNCEYEGIKKVKRIDIKPTPNGDKYRALAGGNKPIPSKNLADYGYADGMYLHAHCRTCGCEFMGDKRAYNCKKCAEIQLNGGKDETK